MHTFLAHILALIISPSLPLSVSTLFPLFPLSLSTVVYAAQPWSHQLQLLPLQLLNMLKYFTKYAKKKKPEIRKKYQKKDEMKYETALQKKTSAKSRWVRERERGEGGGAIGQTLSQRIQFNFHNCNRIGMATFTFHFSHSEFPSLIPPSLQSPLLYLPPPLSYAKWAWPTSEPAKLAPHAPHDHRL